MARAEKPERSRMSAIQLSVFEPPRRMDGAIAEQTQHGHGMEVPADHAHWTQHPEIAASRDRSRERSSRTAFLLNADWYQVVPPTSDPNSSSPAKKHARSTPPGDGDGKALAEAARTVSPPLFVLDPVPTCPFILFRGRLLSICRTGNLWFQTHQKRATKHGLGKCRLAAKMDV